MAPVLLETVPEVLVGDLVSLVGSVFEMSDSVLTAWDGLGVFGNAGDRIVAEFATTFLEANSIETLGGGAAGAGAGN